VNELPGLPVDELDLLVLNGQPTVFRVGSATVLGTFRSDQQRLTIELAQIDGGGEGILVTLGSLAMRYSALHAIEQVEWIVHAVHCAKPNLKLRRVLEWRGFRVCNVPGFGEAYYLLHRIDTPSDSQLNESLKNGQQPEGKRLPPRIGWAEKSREIAARGDDCPVLPEFGLESGEQLDGPEIHSF